MDTPPPAPVGSDAIFVHLFTGLFYLQMPETEAYNQIQIQNHILGRIGKSCQLSSSTCSWDNLLSETDVLQDSSLLTSHGQPPHAHTLEYHSSVQFHVYSTVPPHCWSLFSHLTHPSRPSHGSQFSAAIDLDWITSGSPFFLHHNISSWEETDKVSESHLWVNPDTIQNFSDCVTALWGGHVYFILLEELKSIWLYLTW